MILTVNNNILSKNDIKIIILIVINNNILLFILYFADKTSPSITILYNLTICIKKQTFLINKCIEKHNI